MYISSYIFCYIPYITSNIAIIPYLQMLIVLLTICPVVGDGKGFKVDGLSNKVLLIPGDLNIGVMYGITENTHPEYCNGIIDGEGGVQSIEAARLAIRLINERPDILPNVTLGLVCTVCT